MDPEIIIKVTPHSEGGLSYDVFHNPEDVELPEDPDDGGICLSEAGEDVEELTRKDWKNAFDSARDIALLALFPND
jgi:hypothetical protein